MSGAQGATGYSGAQGATEMAGISGPTGATGAAGPQGAIGPTGAQGPMAAGGSWSPYRKFTFNVNSDEILSADSNKPREVADYLNQDSSIRVSLDGSNGQRVSNVRDALIRAGVPAYKIKSGDFGDPQMRRNDKVEVLVSN
jgi:hypothetical protein